MARIDWEKANAREKVQPDAPVYEPYVRRSADKISFAQAYAKYAAQCRAKGRVPRPPKQWVQSLKY